MKSIELTLVSNHGDVVATAPVLGIQVAAAGEAPQLVDRPAQPVMGQLLAAILGILDRERVEATIDQIDIQMLVGKALLADDDSQTLSIRLPIRIIPGRPELPAPTSDSTMLADPIRFLDGLFDLDDAAEGAAIPVLPEGGCHDEAI